MTMLTDEIRSYIGKQSGAVTACDTVEPGAVRRYAQAIMADADTDYAAYIPSGGQVSIIVTSRLSDCARFASQDETGRRDCEHLEGLDADAATNLILDESRRPQALSLPADPMTIMSTSEMQSKTCLWYSSTSVLPLMCLSMAGHTR